MSLADDPVARSQRWELFYNEAGGLKDILASIQQAYLERMAVIDFTDDKRLAKIAALAMASRVTEELDACVKAIIGEGKVEFANREHVKRIEKLPAAKRRWI